MVGGAEPVDKGLTVLGEGPDVGVDVGGDPVDRDEEGQLPVAERVEDLPVVAASPHVLAVGHDAQLGDVLTGFEQRADSSADADEGQPRVEEGSHHAQGDEVPKGIRAVGFGRVRDDQAAALPVLELGWGTAGQAGGLRGGEAHGAGQLASSSRFQRSRQRRPVSPKTPFRAPPRSEPVRLSRPARPILRTLRSMTSKQNSMMRNPTTPRAKTLVNVASKMSNPMMNPATAHLIMRAAWRYRVVSETCWTSFGSVTERLASMSRRIRCSSSDSGI